MPTPAGNSSGVGSAAKQVAEHASSLAKLELELAGLELKRKAGLLGMGLGLGLGAALLGLFALGFLLVTIAAALATFLDTWLALLLVTVVLFAVVFVLGLLAFGRIKKGTPPLPEQAIREAKLTTEALKANGNN